MFQKNKERSKDTMKHYKEEWETMQTKNKKVKKVKNGRKSNFFFYFKFWIGDVLRKFLLLSNCI